MTSPKPLRSTDAVLEAEIDKFRQHADLLDKTELVAHIGHFEWSYELDCLLSCSQEYARIHDMSVDEVLAAHSSSERVVAQLHPFDRERFRMRNDMLLSDRTAEIEYRIILHDGGVRHIREYSILVDDDSGNHIGVYGILQDVSDRVKHERDLEYRDELARQAESITDIGHFIYDEKSERYLYVSEGYARIYGTSPDDYMTRMVGVENDLADVYEEDRGRVAEEYRHYLETGRDCAIEFRIQRADGSLRWLRELSRAKHLKQGRVTQTLGVVQDITERVTREQELMFKDALANQAETITDIGHFVYDALNQKYLFVSPGLARIHGLTEAEMYDRATAWEGDMTNIHPENRGDVRKAYDRFLTAGGGWQVDYRLIRADGEIRWIREVGKAQLMSGGIPAQTIGVLQDITRQKSAEREIIRARDNLEQQVVARTRELANTVKRLQKEIEEREKIAAELDFLANHDALTGLPSLRLCKDRLGRSLAEARRNRQISAIMFLDLDGFKEINDEYGHEFGDQVLTVTADRIRTKIRETDTVARIGGDEFVVILSSLPEIEIARRIAASLIDVIAQTISVEDIDVGISASIGISLYPDNGVTAEELIRAADKAMYRVKRAGKNSFGFVGAVE
ncbi:MAG: diguanylate cyclase [Gammaproteobacteria bacterium]|nr:diguanylate cyclase [Gammaproteobacteria bacterium]MDH3449199.1 diguanylate cyclase [Gammaproteobacteria bacterium]